MASAVIGALRVQLGLNSAQFTDGLTKAQAQLKKTGAQFQKTGNAMMGVGAGLTVGVTTPILAIGAASMQAAKESRLAFAQVEAALKSMGGASGKTAEQLKASAGQLQALSTFDDDDILQKVTANLLTFGNVSGEAFDRAQLAAVNLSARLGTDLQGSAIQVGKALNDPVKGITALSRVGVSFTEQQKSQIKAMTEAGNVAGAQGIILAELEKQYGGAAKAQRDATPDAAQTDAWREFSETIGEIALKVLPPITAGLTSVLQAFNELSPGMQTGVVALAGVAAAAGPVIGTIGAITTAVGAALPVFAGFAAFLTATLIPAAIATAPVWGPIALAIGAVGLAIAGVIKFWPEIKAFIGNLVQMHVDAAKLVAAAAKNLYAGVKAWLLDKLGAVFKSVTDKVKAVGDAFYQLYDRVVGHSYVPDMVDGIRDCFGQLDGVMVNPAIAANDNVAAAFEATGQVVRTVAEGMEEAFNAVGGSIDGAFRAIKNNDWVGAARSIGDAVKNVQTAFKTGNTGDKVGAVAGAADAIGQQIGGTAGSTLSGAAQGAQLGMTLGGPIGAGIGAIVGGIKGFFTGKKAEKAKKAAEAAAYMQAAAAAAQEELNRQLKIANDNRSLELRIMELSGNAVGALAARRKDELAAMDASSRALQENVWAQEDAAEAVAKARDVLSASYEREASALEATADTFRGFAASLRDYYKTLSMAAGSPLATFAQSASAFRSTAALAQGGDTGALGELQSVSDAYLQAAREVAPDARTYGRTLAQVKIAVAASAGAADAQVSVAEQQLSALQASVYGLININNSVVSVRDAITTLTGAMVAASAAASAAPPPSSAPAPSGAFDPSKYVDNNADLLALFNSGTGMARGRSKAEFGLYHYGRYGQYEPSRIGSFATGGSFKVGGYGAPDSQLMQTRLSPGEMVHVTHGDSMAALAEAVRRLEGTVMAGDAAIATNTRQVASLLKRWDGNGLPEEREAA
jgi:hypothetical protein